MAGASLGKDTAGISNRRVVDQLFNSSEKWLARTLLLLAHFGKESRPQTVIPKVSQDTLAAMVVMTIGG